MKNKDKLHKRAFLNPKTGSAHYEVDIDTKYGGQVSLSDCNRIITLDFDVHGLTPKARRRILNDRIKKAETLAAVFGSVADFLVAHQEDIIEAGRDSDYL